MLYIRRPKLPCYGSALTAQCSVSVYPVILYEAPPIVLWAVCCGLSVEAAVAHSVHSVQLSSHEMQMQINVFSAATSYLTFCMFDDCAVFSKAVPTSP